MAEDGATLTIVTPAYNQVSFLAGVVQNVREQAGGGVQHIVVDGGSTDGSVEFLRSMGDAITWVSEPDRGQAHAINKGMALAQGEVVGWINCDDRYTPGALAFVRRMFARQPTLEFLYGDALGTDVRGRSYGLRSHVRQCDLADLINDGDPIVQPAAFWRRELGEVLGELDESLTYAFDYEFWMRAAERTTLEYVPVCLAVECHHGDAKTSRGAHVRMAEIEEAARRHGGSGIPWGFRSEAAALIASAALGSAARGHPGRRVRASCRRRHCGRTGRGSSPIPPPCSYPEMAHCPAFGCSPTATGATASRSSPSRPR